jgi:ElaA protein
MTATPLTIEIRRFRELTLDELYALLRLRAEVFAVEQNSVYCDLDGHDQEGVHLLGRLDGDLVAYARWYLAADGWHLGRIVTAAHVRGLGYGKALVAEALRHLADVPVVLTAQTHLERFYGALGFARTGPDFILDGIPHLPMRRDPGRR